MAKAKPTVFDEPIARRVVDATQLVERTFKSRIPPPVGNWQAWNPGLLPAAVTTAISAGSLGSPSSDGRVTLYRPDEDGIPTADETGQVVKNYHNAGAAVGKTVTVYWMGGVWWLVAVDC